MRDNHKGMPEIVDAFEKEGQFFGVIEIEVDGIYKKCQFGASAAGYRALRKIMQLRPFEIMPGVKPRYYFTGSSGKIPDSSECTTHVRVEQGKDGKQIDVRVPNDLLANLIWFGRIKDFQEAAHLPEAK